MSDSKRSRKVAPLRASDLKKTRSGADAPAVVPVVDTTTPERPAAAARRTSKEPTVKFTASLDFETSEQFDRLASLARRKLMRQVDKLDVLKALITLAADDASLRDQVIDLIQTRKDGTS